MKKRFTETQVIGFLKEAQARVPVKELCRKHGFSDAAFYGWRAKCGGMQLKLITLGSPTQNAFIESFNGKFRDECLNDHWFETCLRARAIINAWRRDYDEHRPTSVNGPDSATSRHKGMPDRPNLGAGGYSAGNHGSSDDDRVLSQGQRCSARNWSIAAPRAKEFLVQDDRRARLPPDAAV